MIKIPIIGDLIGSVKDVLSEVIVDKDKKIQIEAELRKLEDAANERLHQEVMGQIEINKAEATNSNVFVSGWRPAIGWVCAAALGYNFLLMPLMSWTARVVLSYTGEFPSLDMQSLIVILTGMLGLGGLQTYERFKGVAPPEAPVPTEAPAPKVVTFAPKKEVVQPIHRSVAALPEDAPWSK